MLTREQIEFLAQMGVTEYLDVVRRLNEMRKQREIEHFAVHRETKDATFEVANIRNKVVFQYLLDKGVVRIQEDKYSMTPVFAFGLD